MCRCRYTRIERERKVWKLICIKFLIDGKGSGCVGERERASSHTRTQIDVINSTRLRRWQDKLVAVDENGNGNGSGNGCGSGNRSEMKDGWGSDDPSLFALRGYLANAGTKRQGIRATAWAVRCRDAHQTNTRWLTGYLCSMPVLPVCFCLFFLLLLLPLPVTHRVWRFWHAL